MGRSAGFIAAFGEYFGVGPVVGFGSLFYSGRNFKECSESDADIKR